MLEIWFGMARPCSKAVNNTETAGDSEAGGSLLDAIVHDGARQMLAALRAEVDAYVDSYAFDENVHRLGVRNLLRRAAPGGHCRRGGNMPDLSSQPYAEPAAWGGPGPTKLIFR